MGTYGTATGLVLYFDPVTKAGKLLGLSDGDVQSYFDSDGSIKAAGGDITLDENGMAISVPTGVSYPIYWADGNNTVAYINCSYLFQAPALNIYTKPKTGATIDSGGVLLTAFNSDESQRARISISDEDGVSLSHLDEHGDITWAIANGAVDGGGIIYANLADATADTDALNRQTGDARYAPIAATAATQIGQVAFSVDGSTMTPQLPLTDAAGWLVDEITGTMLVVDTR